MPKYLATNNGVLSSPNYLYVNKGQVINLEKEITASWLQLVPEGEAVPVIEELPAMPNLKTRKKKYSGIPEIKETKSYSDNVKNVDAVVESSGKKSKGTGSKDVL